MASIWAGCHIQLARLADCPELAMGEDEARDFLKAWQNYLRHLSIEASQKTVDLVTACGATIFCYAPRIVALSKKGQRPPQQRPPAGPARIFEFRPNGAAQPEGMPAAPYYEAEPPGQHFGPHSGPPGDPEAAE
jgi:hypothetical protein